MKYFYDNEADIPDALKAYYKKDASDGKFYLQCDGIIPRAKLEEFRENNITLTNELNALKLQFKDVDPTKYAELLKIETDLRSGKLKDGKTVEQIVEERVGTMRTENEKRIKELETLNGTITADLSKLRINDQVVRIATEKGLRETAVDDILGRAQLVFKMENGKVVAYGPDGKERYNKSGKPFEIADFVEEAQTTAVHLFKDSTGGGGGGGGNGRPGAGGGNQVNPWKKETLNLSAQGKIYKENPTLAIKMAAECGKTLEMPAE